MRRRLAAAVGGAMGMLVVLAGAGPALACGGLIGPNGGVSLLKTTTLAGYHNGVEHYVTEFGFTGGSGNSSREASGASRAAEPEAERQENFGSITPLPGIPTKIEKGGNWTLKRLVKEVTPQPRFEALDGKISAAAAPGAAQVIETARVDSLDLTVLKGGGDEVGVWAKDNGFSLPPDAPALLDFYANRSPIFLAAKFDAAAAKAQGLTSGEATPVHLTIPTSNPWVPLSILTLGKNPTEFVTADIFLLTDDKPSMLPAPSLPGATDATSTNGLTLAASEPASASLIRDLHNDQGMGWIPQSGMYLSYLQLNTPAINLRYDLAVDATGHAAPSPVAAGLPQGVAPAPAVAPAITPSRAAWIWAATALAAMVLVGSWFWTYRRSIRA